MMKNRGRKCDNRRHSAETTDKKIERHFPCPERRFNHRLSVIPGFPRNGSAGNIDAAAGHDALLPRFLAQLFQSLLVRHVIIWGADASSVLASASTGRELGFLLIPQTPNWVGKM